MLIVCRSQKSVVGNNEMYFWYLNNGYNARQSTGYFYQECIFFLPALDLSIKKIFTKYVFILKKRFIY